jgi:hypothetical protein
LSEVTLEPSAECGTPVPAHVAQRRDAGRKEKRREPAGSRRKGTVDMPLEGHKQEGMQPGYRMELGDL